MTPRPRTPGKHAAIFVRSSLAVLALVLLPIPSAGRAGYRPASASSLGESAPSVDSALRALVTLGRHPAMVWGDLRDVNDQLRRIYERTGWQPLWIAGGVPTANARIVIRTFADAGRIGLEPRDYDASWLSGWTYSPADTAAARREALFDVALTASALRYARAVRFGRVRPNDAHAELKFPRDSVDLGAVVASLATGSDPGRQLAELEPPYLHYRLLLAALAQYQELSRDTTLLPLGIREVLRPGGQHQSVPRLRRLLVALRDLPDTAAHDPDTTLFDSTLVRGVARFQRRQAMAADGILGAATRARMERPFAAHIRQISLTLERWRWLPHVLADPPIVVNIPAFRLHAFHSSSDAEADLLSMNVAVGRSYDSRTPVFSGALQYLVLSPYWDVPPSIVREEIMPRARRDLSYLARENLEIVRGGDEGATIFPATAASLDAVVSGRARIRQRPGPTNALGRVKFIFPNAHNVYLHDTPSHDVFERPQRDVSHGCIRLGEPVRLAEFVLRDDPTWTPERIRTAMRGTRAIRVNLARPIPVFIVYATVVTRENGETYLYQDIYGHDRALERLLAGGYPYGES